jgi:pimeloyl-ACP methyl ester carboxylesterase
MPTASNHSVILVPGFLGFEHRASTTYFADRFLAGLRAALGGGVPVMPVTTLPVASLAERQRKLLAQLEEFEKKRGPRTWHLIGHSTGGLDAALLLRDQPLVQQGGVSVPATGGWGDDIARVERIGSVTSISAPHWGTALADSRIAEFVEGKRWIPRPRDIVNGARVLFNMALRDDLPSRIAFARGFLPRNFGALRVLCDALFNNELARDLSPAVTVPLSASPVREEMAGRVFSVLTVAPRPADTHPDALFHLLWSLTAGPGGSPPMAPLPAVTPALQLTTQARWNGPLTAADNDGVVNTARQVLGEPIALVVADHADVLGRYRRHSVVDDKVVDPGLLTSGADFGDDPFFELVERIAARLRPLMGLSTGGSTALESWPTETV